MPLSPRDYTRLKGVDSRLVFVAELAYNRIKQELPGVLMFITEGLRTKERQAKLVQAGASRTMKSKHIDGKAFDFALMVGDEVRWDWPLYAKAGAIIKAAAEDHGIPIVWGGDWKKFRDGPHVELKV